MKIKMKVKDLYHYFDAYSEDKNRRLAFQESLMSLWSKLHKISEWERKNKEEYVEWSPKNNTSLKLNFRMYPAIDILDFPEEEKAEGIRYIDSQYRNKNGDLYFAGTKYDTTEELIKVLGRYKWVVELEEE